MLEDFAKMCDCALQLKKTGQLEQFLDAMYDKHGNEKNDSCSKSKMKLAVMGLDDSAFNLVDEINECNDLVDECSDDK